MATLPKRFYAGKPTTSQATFYTVPASKVTILKNVVLTNTSASSATVTLKVNGQSLVDAYSIAGKGTFVLNLSLVMQTGDTLAGLQATTDAVSVFVSGVELDV